jgi:hypothetical protein
VSRGVGFGGSVASSGWTWIADWTTMRICVDFIHETDYTMPHHSVSLCPRHSNTHFCVLGYAPPRK